MAVLSQNLIEEIAYVAEGYAKQQLERLQRLASQSSSSDEDFGRAYRSPPSPAQGANEG